MDEGRIWLLIARKLSKEATWEELQVLDEFFKSNPDQQYAYSLIGALKELPGEAYRWSDSEKELMLERHLGKVDALLNDRSTAERKARYRGRRRMWWAVAASLAFLFGTGVIYYLINIRASVPEKTVFVEKAHPGVYTAKEASSIVLRDGTKVWLNNGSTLKCANGFNGLSREVSLTGEAFFEVAKDSKRPFIVHAGGLVEVQVLGTSFNLKAYPGDPYIEASLVSGKVAVSVKDKLHERVILKPREKVTIYAKSKNIARIDRVMPDIKREPLRYRVAKLVPNPVDHTISETSWMQRKLSFNNITFEELSYDLERIYHVKIQFLGDRIRKYHLTGVFKDESLAEVLQALQVTTPFRYSITDKKVTIYQ